MEVQPLDVTWSKSSRVHSCTTLTAETVHDRPGSKSLTSPHRATKHAKQQRNHPPTEPTRIWSQSVWLDPQSQSSSRNYRSNLPNSLTYIVQLPETVHLGDLLGIWVRRATKIMLPCLDFQGPTRAFRTPHEVWCFKVDRIYSLLISVSFHKN